jgi:chromate reductase
LKILGIVGSLRTRSYNRFALQAAAETLPEGVTMEIADISQIPLYNQDLEAAGQIPEAVRRFKEQIAAADALLIATPEYNYSVPGVLKNALDWASRQGSPFPGKPVAIMGAATGMLGTARAQYHLRQIFVSLDVRPVGKPEVFINQAASKFDAEGRLTDEPTRQAITSLVNALIDWTRRLG